MLDLNELEHFISFSELGTLSKVSEKYHISTPTITRSMQHIEEVFGVPLFSRGKNKIELNETGIYAVECAKTILSTTDSAILKVRDFHKSLHTVIVQSCAPAPLWNLLPKLSSAFPNVTISSSIYDTDIILKHLMDNTCEIGILPYDIPDTAFKTVPFMKEHLSIFIKKDHELANKKSVRFSDINGFNFLLRTDLGFWDTLCRQKMPASKFLVQNNEFDFLELIRTSSLPCFVTDVITDPKYIFEDRVRIPITDPEANVTFYLAFQKNMEASIKTLLL
ncbi:MAG: LysR family transcriptional regulator [bacterium]|nr:LysR family transcriptional regulator [bacterium]